MQRQLLLTNDTVFAPVHFLPFVESLVVSISPAIGMGGGAFKHAVCSNGGTIVTPRLSSEDYQQLKRIYLDKLRRHFQTDLVFCLTEAPEKVDHGDVDMVVPSDKPVDLFQMAKAIGAVATVSNGAFQKCSLAVHVDGTSSDEPVIQYWRPHNVKTSTEEALVREPLAKICAQVDVEVIPFALVDWYAFYSSYGDMAAILGRIVSQFGFRFGHYGLELRMQELDLIKDLPRTNVADAEARILLCNDPTRVMEFLGLSSESFHRGFDEIKDLFEWLNSCRLLHVETARLCKNRSKDRQKLQTRKLYAQFFSEWLPKHRPQMRDDCPDGEVQEAIRELRDSYTDEAVKYFGKCEQYEQMHQRLVHVLRDGKPSDHRTVKLNFTLAEYVTTRLMQSFAGIVSNLLRNLLEENVESTTPKPGKLLRALRRFVRVTEEGEPSVDASRPLDSLSELHRLLAPDAKSLRDRDLARAFVENHWREVMALERGGSIP